jgi:hypothetical protein
MPDRTRDNRCSRTDVSTICIAAIVGFHLYS